VTVFVVLQARAGDEVVLLCAVEKLEKNLKNSLLVDFDYQIIDSANKHRVKEATRTSPITLHIPTDSSRGN